MDTLTERIWVGRLAADGDTLVFDSSWQPSLPRKVRLFSVETGQWRIFLADLVRTRLTKLQDPALVRTAVEAYEKFESAERQRESEERMRLAADRGAARAERDAWLATEAARRRERMETLNRQRLASLGIASAFYQVRAEYLPDRSTWCWACKQPLDSRHDLEHVECGWLVCSCGACGCGRAAV